MLIRRNAPGPTLKKSSVVGLFEFQQERPHCSIGWRSSTATGAAHRARPIGATFATALARIVTELKPKSFAKKPGAGRAARTSIVSSGLLVLRTVMSPAATPPSFVVA